MTKEFDGVKAFLMIPAGIARDKDLLKKPKSILLMGEILSMLNTTGSFYMSNARIAENLGVSKRSVIDYLNLLETKGLIKREVITEGDSKHVLGRKVHAGTNLMNFISLGWSNEDHGGGKADFTRVVQKPSPKYNNIKEQNNITEKSSSSYSSSSKNLNSTSEQQILEEEFKNQLKNTLALYEDNHECKLSKNDRARFMRTSLSMNHKVVQETLSRIVPKRGIGEPISYLFGCLYKAKATTEGSDKS